MPNESHRSTPVLVIGAVLLACAVLAGILLVGRLGAGDATPTPAPVRSPSGATASAPADPRSTPEGAVRAFFTGFADARRVGDPAPVADLVASQTSPAYLTVAGFLEGQKAAGKSSIVTVQQLDNLTTTIDGSTATVVFDLTEGGYDVRLADASPLESPQVLAPSRVTVELVLVDGHWLVSSFESAR